MLAGIAANRLGDLTAAAARFQRAMEMDPEKPEAVLNPVLRFGRWRTTRKLRALSGVPSNSLPNLCPPILRLGICCYREALHRSDQIVRTGRQGRSTPCRRAE